MELCNITIMGTGLCTVFYWTVIVPGGIFFFLTGIYVHIWVNKQTDDGKDHKSFRLTRD